VFIVAKQLEPKNVNLRPDRYDYRVVYEKCGRAKYISHLDLMRAMQRAIKRSKLPIWYTQGFNPHIYIMFPLTLSLGFESRVEVMDFALLEDLDFEEVRSRLDSQMPEGMKIVSCGRPVHSHTEITSAEYKIILKTSLPAEKCVELFRDFLSKDKIEIEKRTKKKTFNTVDICPHINVTEISADGDSVYITVVLPAGGQFSLNANVVAEAFLNMYNIENADICIERTKIMIENGENFT
jgi:radical SAM-linked protein